MLPGPRVQLDETCRGTRVSQLWFSRADFELLACSLPPLKAKLNTSSHGPTLLAMETAVPLYGAWYKVIGTEKEGTEMDQNPLERNPPREEPG